MRGLTRGSVLRVVPTITVERGDGRLGRGARHQALAERLDLIDVLNLDGGGSTTMVIKGDVVNRPTDLVGPRRVSDAIVVTAH